MAFIEVWSNQCHTSVFLFIYIDCIRGGANIYNVKEFLGHEDLQTLKPYTLLTVTDLRKTHAECHPREKEKDE